MLGFSHGGIHLSFVAQAAAPGNPDPMRELAGLVAEMRAGKEGALDAIYSATVGKVFALAHGILRDRADAEEIACDTYSQAWYQAHRFDAERGNVLSWLLTICRSRALDRLRERRRDQESARVDLETIDNLPDGQERPEELLSLLQEGTRVHAALAGLSAERQRLVGMAFLRGMSHQEIAATTSLPLGTVKSHLRRALGELRAALES